MDRITLWLKTHAAGEKSFARALQRFFADQADRIADAITEIFPEYISADQVALIFSQAAEHELLLPIVQRNLGNLMAMGARAELAAAKAHSKPAKDFDPTTDIAWGQLPANVRDRIRETLRQSTEQPYWAAIQAGVEVDIRSIIEAGVSQGFSSYKIGGMIQRQLGGTMARKRATRIARTETGGALNSGHLEAMRSLGDAVTSKKWLAIGDKDTRETHSAAHGQTVPVNGSFNVGGYEADYPGAFSLPAAERIGCRCVVISLLREDILLAADNPELDR